MQTLLTHSVPARHTADLNIQNHRLLLYADPSRVVVRPFHIAWQAQEIAASRPARLVNEVLRMEEHTAREQLEAVLKDFEERHWQTRRVFMTRYEEIEAQLKLDGHAISDDKRQHIGAYLCREISYASSALINPSVVPIHEQDRKSVV